MASEDRVLWSTELRDDSELRLTTHTFKGTEYVSLRNYWRTPSGQWLPTKKGCTFDSELVPEIVAALGQLTDDDS